MTSPATSNAYLRTKVLTAGPGELMLMLYDGAIRFAEQAREGVVAKDYEKAFNGFTRAQDIVLELMNALRPQQDPGLCERLSALYTFIYKKLVSASTERDVVMVDEALDLLRYERETWMLLLRKLATENERAGKIDETPEAPAPLPANESAAKLIGGRVSVRG